MSDVDYKKVFDSVFENATAEELGCFVRNEDVPFEYCERALKTKGFGWHNKLLVALRSDCPKKTLLRICKKAGERFVGRMLCEMKDIPEDVIRMFYENSANFYLLLEYNRLPEDIKRSVMWKLVTCDDGKIVKYSDTLGTFLEHQYSIPDDCWGLVDSVCGLYSTANDDNPWTRRKDIPDIVKFMRTPIDEDAAVGMIDKYGRHEPYKSWGFWFKIASNPSISDYLVMELRMKAPKYVVDEVERILDENECRRNEWRKIHGERTV